MNKFKILRQLKRHDQIMNNDDKEMKLYFQGNEHIRYLKKCLDERDDLTDEQKRYALMACVKELEDSKCQQI